MTRRGFFLSSIVCFCLELHWLENNPLIKQLATGKKIFMKWRSMIGFLRLFS